ncbi:nickel-type superoxide dismutase maturation protease, partial [Streptomyces alkaliphilus]|uniref:nickel-type superoxide dismutase maturation protease n=1 Tax=Streptomyces alkaliphilus TaxID=1472722 RepID=UPI001887BFCE
ARVHNDSMLPTLRPGDRLLLRWGASVRPGDVVVARHPWQPGLLIVKRALAHRPNGWWLVGDNPRIADDSRAFGAVPAEEVPARALLRLRPPSRTQPSRLRSALEWVGSAVRRTSRPVGASSRPAPGPPFSDTQP